MNISWKYMAVAIVGCALLLPGCPGGDGSFDQRERKPQGGKNVEPVARPESFTPDPALLKLDSGFRATGEYETGLDEVFAMAVGPDDRIYVAGEQKKKADEGSFKKTENVLLIISPEGKVIAMQPLNESPTAIAVACSEASDPNRVYIAFRDHIGLLDLASGEVIFWPSLGPGSWVTGIAVEGDNIFLADSNNKRVGHFDANGELLSMVGQSDQEEKNIKFVVPSPYFDLAIDHNGLLRVVNPGGTKILQFDLDGEYLGSWGRGAVGKYDVSAFYGCCNPSHIAILPDGDIVTSEKGLPRVKLFSDKGKYKGMIATTEELAMVKPPKTVGDPMTVGVFDVAADSAGRVLLLDPNRRSVRVYEKEETPE